MADWRSAENGCRPHPSRVPFAPGGTPPSSPDRLLCPTPSLEPLASVAARRPTATRWEFSTIARRGTNQSGRRSVRATGANVSLDSLHYLVTLRKPAAGLLRDYEYDNLVAANGVLANLDARLE